MLGAWLALLAGTAPLGARFEGAQSNEPSSFLPGGAESLRASEAAARFPSGQQLPAVIVFQRESGLTPADRALIASTTGGLGRGLPPIASAPLPPRYASDGRAALVVVPIRGGELEPAAEVVADIREQLSPVARTGLEAKVGGPAGFAADTSEAFQNINGRLLIATALLVFVLLIVIYRSPIFWFIPLLSIFAAEGAVRALGYLVTEAGVVVNGQSGGILLVLVFGAGTDYALLLVARYREELRGEPDRHVAMRTALLRAGPSIIASAATVVAGLLCLAVADVNGTAGIGTIGALGVAVAAIAILTILPALLLVFGRWVFWPFEPRPDQTGEATARGMYLRLGERLATAPRRAWVASVIVLLAGSAGLAGLDFGLTSTTSFRGDVEAVAAQKLVARSFPAGAEAPIDVIVLAGQDVARVRDAVARTPGVAAVGPVELAAAGARFSATLEPAPYSEAAFDLIPRLRRSIADVAGGRAALIGGPTAEERDLRVASARDTVLLPPLVLLVVLLILIALLRSLVAPLILIATVVLSYAAALGVSVIVFEYVFGFAGVDPSFPLIAFIFLVALGVDYNIFLMARVREESQQRGTRAGVLRGLSATGAVITSAGIVLAGTFAVLGVLPFVPLTQIGFTVAFGVVLDTLLVRSVLVPALVLDLDTRTWWPSRMRSPAAAGAVGDPLGARPA